MLTVLGDSRWHADAHTGHQVSTLVITSSARCLPTSLRGPPTCRTSSSMIYLAVRSIFRRSRTVERGSRPGTTRRRDPLEVLHGSFRPGRLELPLELVGTIPTLSPLSLFSILKPSILRSAFAANGGARCCSLKGTAVAIAVLAIKLTLTSGVKWSGLPLSEV